MPSRWLAAALFALTPLLFASRLPSEPPTPSQALNATLATGCQTARPWDPVTTYLVGAQVTYQGRLYQALVSTTNIQPTYCADCGWWKDLGLCETACAYPPSVPMEPISTGRTSSSVSLAWLPSTAGSRCTVTYRIYSRGILIQKDLASPSTSIQGLKPSTTYTFTIAAADAAGVSAQSSPVTVATTPACSAAPAVPTGLTASGISASSVVLNWNPVAPLNWCAITYRVYSRGILIRSGLNNPSLTLSGLSPSKSYAFTVAAEDPKGVSAQSAAVAVTTLGVCSAAPAVPTDLVCNEASPTEAILSWGAVPAPPYCTVTYRVYSRGIQIWSGPASSFVRIPGLRPQQTYSFTVTAADAFGVSAHSQALLLTTPGVCAAAPSVPTGLKATRLTGTSLRLEWLGDAPPRHCDQSTYGVYMNGGMVDRTPDTFLLVTGLTPETPYTFTVLATNQAGDSAPSQSLAVATLPLVLAPPVRSLAEDVSVMTWKDGAQSALTLGFDDGYLSQMIQGTAILHEQGLPATFNIPTNFVGSSGYYGTWADIRTLQAIGHEVASHGHQHWDLTRLSVSESILRQEMSQSQDAIQSNNPETACISLAYPFGAHDAITEAFAADYYLSARAEDLDPANPQWNPGALPDYFRLRSYTPRFPATRNSLADDTPEMAVVQFVLQRAIQQQAWAMLNFNEVRPYSNLSQSAEVAFRPVADEWLTLLCQWIHARRQALDIWPDTQGTITRYSRERDAVQLSAITRTGTEITLEITDGLDDARFDLPLTLEIKVPEGWSRVKIIMQGGEECLFSHVPTSARLRIAATPDRGPVRILRQ